MYDDESVEPLLSSGKIRPGPRQRGYPAARQIVDSRLPGGYLPTKPSYEAASFQSKAFSKRNMQINLSPNSQETTSLLSGTGDHYYTDPRINEIDRPQAGLGSIRRYRDGSDARFGNGILHNENPVKDYAGFISHGCFCTQCVRSNEVGILESFGKFQRLIKPGLICMPWPCTRLAARVSLRIQQLDLSCEAKSKDSVFVTIKVAVLYKVIAEESYSAHYRLTSPKNQIESYLFDKIRSTVPSLEVDKLFLSRSEFSLDILRSLQLTMSNFGYEILDVLVTQISPDSAVKAAMNEINAAKRLKYASLHKGETEKISKVKSAEALAEAAHLQGIGTARQRQEIVKNMKTSLQHLDPGINHKDVMDILTISQYYDMLSSVGCESALMKHSLGEVNVFKKQIEPLFNK